MATPPKPLQIRAEELGDDVPAWALALVEQLNVFAAQVNESLTKGITRGDNLAGTSKEITFTYAGDGAAGIPVAHGLTSNPKNVGCNISYFDGTEPVGANAPNANSMWFRNSSDGRVLLYFQGLATGVKYRAALTFD
jgi:hypothetical protein